MILGPNLLQEMEQLMCKTQQNVKAADDCQKIYANKKSTHKEFKIWDHFYLRVKLRKRNLRRGTCSKLSPCFCGPFEVLDRLEPIAYQLVFPSHIKAHKVFHVSLLKKYIHDSTHIIDLKML